MYLVEIVSGTKTLLRGTAQTETDALSLSEKLFAEAHKNFPEFGKTIATCISEGVNE